MNAVVAELFDQPFDRQGLELIFAGRTAPAKKLSEIILKPFSVRSQDDLAKRTVTRGTPWITGALGKTSCGLAGPPTLPELFKFVGKVLHAHFGDFIVNVLRPGRLAKQTLVQL